MSAGDQEFPTARNLKVEELIARYDGIIPAADELLADSIISKSLTRPSSPHGLGGVVEFEKAGDPVLPDDLTDLDSLTLGKLFTFMSNWTNYVEAEVSRAKSILLVEKRKLKLVEACLNIYYKEDLAMAANKVKDKVLTDERFIYVDAETLKIEVFAKTADARADQCRRSLNLLSREQTRRSDELKRSLHGHGDGYGGGRDTDLPFRRD